MGGDLGVRSYPQLRGSKVYRTNLKRWTAATFVAGVAFVAISPVAGAAQSGTDEPPSGLAKTVFSDGELVIGFLPGIESRGGAESNVAPPEECGVPDIGSDATFLHPECAEWYTRLSITPSSGAPGEIDGILLQTCRLTKETIHYKNGEVVAVECVYGGCTNGGERR